MRDWSGINGFTAFRPGEGGVPVGHGQLVGHRVRDIGVQAHREAVGRVGLREVLQPDRHARAVDHARQPGGGVRRGGEGEPAMVVRDTPILGTNPQPSARMPPRQHPQGGGGNQHQIVGTVATRIPSINEERVHPRERGENSLPVLFGRGHDLGIAVVSLHAPFRGVLRGWIARRVPGRRG